MFKFFINYNNFWNNLLPINKRFPRFISWGKVLMSPLDWLMINFTENHLKTGFSNFFDDTDYDFGDMVIGLDNCVYRCIKATSTSGNPTILNNTEYFIKHYNNFIAVNTQLQYNSSIGVLEWILNTEMYCLLTNSIPTLINPPYQNTLNSSARPSIYVDTNTISQGVFLVGTDVQDTTVISYNDISAIDTVGLATATFNSNSFTVYYDSTLLDATYFTATKYENKIKTIVDRVNLAGLKYDIQSY
jgi:hypothetical protein